MKPPKQIPREIGPCKTFNLRGLGLKVYSVDGKMYAMEVCSCGGCFWNEFEIMEGDRVVAFKHLNICHNAELKNITLEAMEIFTGNNVKLDNVKLISHPEATKFYCGGAIYSNNGVEKLDVLLAKGEALLKGIEL
jgi:hypothetical protein